MTFEEFIYFCKHEMDKAGKWFDLHRFIEGNLNLLEGGWYDGVTDEVWCAVMSL